MSYTFEIKDTTKMTYIGIRKNQVSPQQISTVLSEVLPKVFAFVQEKGITPLSPPLTLYHCHDGEQGTFDLQGGFFIAEKVESSGEIECGEIDAKQLVSTKHIGPYEDLGKAHEAASKWLQEQGKKAITPCWEVYLNDPGEVEPQQYITEIVYPIAES